MSNAIKTSITVQINALAQAKRAAGARVFNFSAGEPKLPTPQVVKEAAKHFIDTGDICYPSPAGMPELRDLAANFVNSHYGSSYNKDECTVIVGGKLGIYLGLQYLLGNSSPIRTNDEKIGVLIPVPYWVSYADIVNIFNGTVHFVYSSEAEDWKVTPESLAKAYDKNVKVLLLNNGVNPSGALYTEKEIKAIMEFAKKHDITVIADEVYSGLVYDNGSYASCAAYPEYKENVILIQSCSKNFAMTGWRIGFMFAPVAFTKVMASLMSQSTTGVSLISQHAAIAAFKNEKEIIADINEQMTIRRDLMVKTLKVNFDMPNLKNPPATLYVFLSLKDLGVPAGMSDEEFCLQALDKANIASVPGSGFGQAGYMRLSFTPSLEDIKDGVEALAAFVKTLV